MNDQELKNLPINKIRVKENYRKTFDEKSLKELAVSISENGVLEPIIVYKNGSGFVIIAGERRFRASKMANLVTIPAIIRNVSELDAQKFQLIENVQREDVPFMEEAYGIKNLRDKHALNASEISKMLGKSEGYIYKLLQLTEMTEYARKIASAGYITKSVALIIAKLPKAEYQDQAVADLQRKTKDNLIAARTARRYVQDNFKGETVTQPKKKSNSKNQWQ